MSGLPAASLLAQRMAPVPVHGGLFAPRQQTHAHQHARQSYKSNGEQYGHHRILAWECKISHFFPTLTLYALY